MRRPWTLAVLTLGACVGVFAQAPAITAILDAGAYASNLAPGTVFVVKGTNLCTSGTVASLPYGTAALGGTSVALAPVAGGAALDAYMIYTYSAGGVTQLAAELPSTAAAGDYNVTVKSSGGTSAPFKTTVVAQKPGLMTVSGSGGGRALLQNAVTGSQYDLNGFTSGAVSGASFLRSPAKPSEFLIAWAVGLGAATGYDATAPSHLDFLTQGLDVKAVVGGVEITPAFAGRSNLFPGLDNVVFQLPANVATGCFVSFQIKVAGRLSNATTIAIAPDAQSTACVDAQFNQTTLSKLDNGGALTTGFFGLSSLSASTSISGQSFTSLVEGASGLFARYSADTITQLTTNLSQPGTVAGCQVYRSSYTVDLTSSSTGSGSGSSGLSVTLLDAGTLTLSGPNVSNKAFTETSDVYTVSVGNPIPGSPPVIAAGTYTVTGSGGKDIGPFTASITVPAPLSVTSGLPGTVNRGQDLTIRWTGGGTNLVLISGTSFVITTNSSTSTTYDEGIFYCQTTADKGSLTIPASVLSQMPAASASDMASLKAFTSLAIEGYALPTSGIGMFTAPLVGGGNLDYGYMVAVSGATAGPVYQ